MKRLLLTAAGALWISFALYWVSLLHAGHLLRFQNWVEPTSFASLIVSSSSCSGPKLTMLEHLKQDTEALVELVDSLAAATK